MAGHYIVAGLELFKRSQMAIFDKALSIVDLFDSAVSDTFVVMQDMYEFEQQQKHSSWDRFLLLLEGCYRHIRLYFTFTIAMICCTFLMLRRRKKRRRMFMQEGRIFQTESPNKPPGGNNCASETIKSENLREINVNERSQNAVSEKPDVSQMSKGEENSAVTTDTATRTLKEMETIEEKTEPNQVDMSQAPSIDENECSRESTGDDLLTRKSKRRKTKKPRGGSLAFEENKTFSNKVSFIPAKKPWTAVHQRTSDKGWPSRIKFPKVAKNKLICAAQKKGSGKKKAQIFILLGDVAKERRNHLSPNSKSCSPSKHFQDTQSTASSPKKRISPLAIKKNYLRERKPFNGRGPLSKRHDDTQTNSMSERQKLQASIPYLHTLSPKRHLPFKAVPQKNKQSTGKQKSKNPKADDPKPLTGFYLSPNTRMAKTNSKNSKKGSESPTKRCKSCKKIRQYPEYMPETKLLQIRKKAKSNIGSLFCFSPEAKLPAPFCNARMDSTMDNLHYSRTPCYRADSDQLGHCVEDTNMNKTVLKLELQNNNPNNHKKVESRFAIHENSFHSSTMKNERFNEAMRYRMDSKRHPDCAPCRIQHNVYPADVNEMHITSAMCQEDVESEVCHSEGICHGQTRRISNIFRPPRTQGIDNRRTLGSDVHHAGVQDSTAGNQFDVCDWGNPNTGPFSLSRIKNLHAFDTSFDGGLDEYRKSKGRHCRESRRRLSSGSFSNKAKDPFCSPRENVAENQAAIADTSMMCGQDSEVLYGTQPKSESECNHVVDEEEHDVPRHCDKIKSLKWRHRHEPYRWVSTKTKSTREDPSLTAFTNDASFTRISDGHSDKALQAQSHVLAITDLSQLAQFTASTEESKDVSSSDIDPCTFSVRSTTSYQNKNNCSPSRLTKPFIKPTSVSLAHPTIDPNKSGNVNGHGQIIGAGSKSAGSKDTLDSCLNWQEGSDESRQVNSFSTDSALTQPRVPTGEGHRLNEQLSSQTQQTDPAKRPMDFIPSPHSDTKLGSVRKASVATQNFYYRPRNKSLRQHKLFKYPSIARKAVMRAIGQHVPTYSPSGHFGAHRHSVTLGVQTSHTSLRHIAVQTSPQERRRPRRRIPVRIHHHQTNSRPEIANTLVRDEDDSKEDQLDKTQSNFWPVQKLCLETSPEVINYQASHGTLRNLEEADTLVSLSLKNEYALDVTNGNSSGKDSSFRDPGDSSLISSNAHDIDVTSDTKSNDLKPFIVPIRRQSLPILSLSMTTDDVKSDVIASPSRDNSPSNNLLDVESSKEWLTRPKWENANEDEVNRRVERALKLRQELQKCRTSKTPNSPQRIFRPSFFGEEHEDILFDKASTSTFKARQDRGASPSRQAAKNSEMKRNITPSFKASVRIENLHSAVKRDDGLSITGTVPVRRVESSTTDTLVKTFPFVARQAESFVSENTSPGKKYKMSTKHGDVAIETDDNSDTPEQSHQSHQHGAGVAVPDSTEVRPSSATSLSQNTTDSYKVDENYDNDPKRTHRHPHQQQQQQQQHNAHPQNRPVTKNSPPIKISKMENVIQTEYPKLVGELVQALPHVPLASFVEWFIETSNPGQFLSSDESTSTATDVKEAPKETVNNARPTLGSGGNDATVIYIRCDAKDDDYVDSKNVSPVENEQQRDKINIMTPSMSQSSPDIFNSRRDYQSLPSADNRSHIEATEAGARHDDTPIPDEDPEGNVASIRRILLTRKDSSNESLDIATDNRRRIITLRQTSNASPFEGNLPSHQ